MKTSMHDRVGQRWTRKRALLAAGALAALQSALAAPALAQQQPTDAFITPADVVDLIAEGRKRLTAGDPQGAIQDFENALARDPNNPQVLYFLGNLYLQLNQVEQGLKYLARSVELMPQNMQLRLVLAKAYEQFGRFDDAMREYQEIMRRAPGSAEGREAEERNRSVAEQRRISRPPDTVTQRDLDALIAEGRRQLNERDSVGALRVFKSVLAHDPDNVEILYFAGNLHMSLGQPIPGIAYLRRAAALAPDIARLRFTLAQAYEYNGLLEDALQELLAAASVGAGTPEGEAARQRVPELTAKLRAQREAEAIPDMTTDEVLAEGRHHLDARNSEQALRYFKAYLITNPDNVEVRYFVGNLLLTLNQPVAGVRELERAAALGPDLVRLRLTLAQAYDLYGATESAISEYAAVAAMAPGTPEGNTAVERESALAGRMAMIGDDAIILAADIGTLMDEAKRLYIEGDPQGSLRMFEAILVREPDNTEALYLASVVYRAMNRPREGIAALQRAAELEPERKALRLELAQAFERVGLMGDALREYGVLAEDKASPEVAALAQTRIQMLGAMRALGAEPPDPNEAARIYGEVLTRYPDDPPLFSEAMGLMVEGQHIDETRAMLEKVIAARPGHVLPRMFLADLYLFLDDLPNAASQYEAVLQVLPADHPSRQDVEVRLANARGIQALRDGEYAAAKKQFEKIIALAPAAVAHDARLNLTASLVGLGDTAGAELSLRSMIEENPDDAGARIRLGNLYYDTGRPEEAAREFEELLVRARGTPVANQASQFLTQIYSTPAGQELKTRVQDSLLGQLRADTEANPDDLTAWSRLTMLLLQLNRREEAITGMENMVRLNPDNLAAKEGLGDMYDQSSEYDKAVAVYTDILDRSRDQEVQRRIGEKVKLMEGKKAFNDGKSGLAMQHFEEVAAASPDNFLANFYLAILYAEAERYDDAARAYEEVVRVQPNHIGAHVNLGVMYEQLNREEDAVVQYRDAIRLAPPGDARNGATARLVALEKRIHGFSYALNYSTSYSTNNNLTASNPTGEFRSDLSGNINYRHKLENRPIYLGFIFSPTYTMYHRTQFDLINLSYSPYATYAWRDYDFSATLTHSEMESLATEIAVNTSDSISVDASRNFRMISLLPWLGTQDDRGRVSSSARVTFSGRRFESASSPIFSSLNRSVNATLTQTLGDGWRGLLGYTFINNNNLERFIGTDFAYISHGITFQLVKTVGPGLVANGTYSYSTYDYKNPDSATLFTRYRRNTSHNISAGLNYYPNNALRLFTNLSYQINESNLPTGFILSPGDVGTAIGLQSTSLGDYRNLIVSTGVGFNF